MGFVILILLITMPIVALQRVSSLEKRVEKLEQILLKVLDKEQLNELDIKENKKDTGGYGPLWDYIHRDKD